MNSLHVKSFFEYLMGIPNDYWTNVPNDPDPASQLVRDGVAVEDDMVLRALIPHMRPKRGRKRPDESETPLSAQRPRLSPSSAIDGHRPGDVPPWLAPGRGGMSAHPDTARSAHPGLGPGDGSITPFSRWPESAITPSTRGVFWDDDLSGEPRSAMSPLNPKAGRHRRGTKNVSSAWRVGGADSGGKMRGRPPVNRTPIEGPGISPFSVSLKSHETAAHIHTTQAPPPAGPTSQPPSTAGETTSQPRDQPTVPFASPRRTMTAPAMTTGIQNQNQNPPDTNRPPRPSISLQVPQRTGGPVRLATPPPPPIPVPPPPAVFVSGTDEDTIFPGHFPQGRRASTEWPTRVGEVVNHCRCHGGVHRVSGLMHAGIGECIGDYHFERAADRTNVDSLLNYFARMTREGEWVDTEGNAAERPSPDEITAITNAMVEDIYRNSTSPETFLVNLGALAGARMLMDVRPRYVRLPDGVRSHSYGISWEYRFSNIRGAFSMTQSVPWSMYQRPGARESALGSASAPGSCQDGNAGHAEAPVQGLSAEDWKRKYETLLHEVGEREQMLAGQNKDSAA